MSILMRENYGSHIGIDLAKRHLHFSEGTRKTRTYPVGVGKPSTPTPTGSFKIVNKILNPGSILGTRWMGLSIPNGNYGIHGTNNPSSIGGYVSNGCIRMYNEDIEEIFPLVQIGTAVDIYNGMSKSGLDGAAYKSGPVPGYQHTVRPGESLWEIAQKYGISLKTILAANNIVNPDEIFPGQKIIIPG